MKILITLLVLSLAMALPMRHTLAQGQEAGPEAKPAAQAEPQTAEEWEHLAAQAKEMRVQAKQMRAAAAIKNEEAQIACWQKFLVSSCQADAKKELRETGYAAKRIEVEAGRIERSVKAHEREARMQRRIDEAPQRAAANARRAEEIRLQEEQAMQRMAEKRRKNGLE